MVIFSKSAIAALPTLAEMRLARRSEAASAMAEARLARRSEALAKRQAKIADTLTPIALAKPEEPAIEPQAVMQEPITKPTMQEAPQTAREAAWAKIEAVRYDANVKPEVIRAMVEAFDANYAVMAEGLSAEEIAATKDYTDRLNAWFAIEDTLPMPYSWFPDTET